ncbi:pyroglutamyl-peptidase I [Legionella spiritensis]|uniref:pyroglutamyl-peptidase I n=1 Tax=Legionella spiritensis TaxID=452 RepID=UPI000F6D9F48|nr:pyroglutamyl-peptidase I [Legionella spiritensis]VEG92138.1 Pyrrolidone-carboxylate peptidase [Legionella spiritensis]
MPILLLTGFEPYGTTPVNPAEQVARTLHGEVISNIEVISTIVPNTFFKSIDHVKKLIREQNVDYVLMMGEYTGRAMVTFERFAHRIIDSSRYQLSDNEGVSFDNQETVEDGPVAYQSNLPLKAMVETLRRNAIPADISDTAGTFVCNHLFYGILHEIVVNNMPIKAGWAHLPMLPGTAALQENLGMPSMSVETSAAAIRFAIQAIAENPVDIKQSLAAGLQI